MKTFLTSLLLIFLQLLNAQETLLLGELRTEEINIQQRTDHLKKVTFYVSKYKKKGNYKDSTLIGIEDYDTDGLLKTKISFRGKKQERSSQSSYEHKNNLVVEYSTIHISPEGSNGRSGKFAYDSYNRLVYQEHSLANIKYTYFNDGRMKTKSYLYKNRGEEETKPWVHFYFYDDSLNLTHVDTDEKSEEQTSFYNKKNQLIKNDYYPGVAYSIYEYDLNGNCKKQSDFEKEKTIWSSIEYLFTYTNEGKIATSSTTNQKGKISLNEEYFYKKNGDLDYVIYLRKNKRKQIKKVFYSYFKE